MDGADRYADTAVEPVGLQTTTQASSGRARLFRGLVLSAPFSSLQRRIIFFNLIGLAILVLGVLYLNQFRSGLIEQRVDALRTHGQIIALTLAESAALLPEDPAYDPQRADAVLDRLAEPTGVRARLFNAELELVGDTRDEGAPPPPEPQIVDRPISKFFQTLEEAYLSLVALVREPAPLFRVPEAPDMLRPEILAAAQGDIAQAIRINAERELIVSVALPVHRNRQVLGVLVLSTEGADINRIVQRERLVILQVFVIATVVSVALSVLLANTIASPIRRLADAADPSDTTAQRPLTPDRIEIPDLTERTDEIGDLSAAMIRMTHALYRRIEAIETFAADVAHEIKNPLTSLRSAVETMRLAKTPEQRQRLLDVIKHDVGRLDRLVTDIANASRLDAELVRERMEHFDLAELIRTLAAMIEMQGSESEIRVAAILPDEGLMARGLEGRLAQVITNLLDNALSFSPEGGTIRIEAKQVGHVIRIEVSDQGTGIPEDSLESIFERFYSERPESEGFGNHSGLGLSISKQIVEAHGGRIRAENRVNPADPDAPPVGARFIIELPA